MSSEIGARQALKIFCSTPHDGEITTACFSPTDSAIAVGTTERKAYIWDCFTGDLVSVFEGKPVSCQNLKIQGAKGLDARGYSVENGSSNGTLGEWLIERGAYWPKLSKAIDKTKALLWQLDERADDFSWRTAEKKAQKILAQLTRKEQYFREKRMPTPNDLERRNPIPKISPGDIASILSLIANALVRRTLLEFPDLASNLSGNGLSDAMGEFSKRMLPDDVLRYRVILRDMERIRESDPNDDAFESDLNDLEIHLTSLFHRNRIMIQPALKRLAKLRSDRIKARTAIIERARNIIGSFRESDLLELTSVLK